MQKEIITIKPTRLSTPEGSSSSPKASPLGKRQLTTEGMPPGHSPPSTLTPDQRKALDRIAREITFLMGLMGVLIVVALIVIMIILG